MKTIVSCLLKGCVSIAVVGFLLAGAAHGDTYTPPDNGGPGASRGSGTR